MGEAAAWMLAIVVGLLIDRVRLVRSYERRLDDWVAWRDRMPVEPWKELARLRAVEDDHKALVGAISRNIRS